MLTARKCLAHDKCLMNGSHYYYLPFVFSGSFRPLDVVTMMQRNPSIPLLLCVLNILGFSS